MDNATVQNLIDKLRDLTATKFAEKAGGEPVFEATVTSNEGKRVEKVTISKQGSQYFAKRENEPSIYELDAKAVEDLQKAAADVKEAPPDRPRRSEARLTAVSRRRPPGKGPCHVHRLDSPLLPLVAARHRKCAVGR